jgi:hypothetical protein
MNPYFCCSKTTVKRPKDVEILFLYQHVFVTSSDCRKSRQSFVGEKKALKNAQAHKMESGKQKFKKQQKASEMNEHKKNPAHQLEAHIIFT